MKPTKLHPSKGTFLLSEPFLPDPNFRRSVVLLTEHNEEGSVGFILNRPTQYKLNDVSNDFPFFNSILYVGGPVQQETLHFIHRVEELKESSIEIKKGLYWGGDFEQVKELVNAGKIFPEQFRFFLGYSGWAPNQLIEEMDTKSWIVANGNSHVPFSEDHDNLWREVLKTMGRRYEIMSNYPEDPSLN